MAGSSSHDDAHCTHPITENEVDTGPRLLKEIPSLRLKTPPPTVSCLPRPEDSRDTQADKSMFLGDMGVLHSAGRLRTPQGHCQPFLKLGLVGNRDTAIKMISLFHSLSNLPHPLMTLPALPDSLSISSHGCLLHGTRAHSVLLYSVHPPPKKIARWAKKSGSIWSLEALLCLVNTISRSFSPRLFLGKVQRA